MKRASDFRRTARDALRGVWGPAVLAGLIASILGATASGSPRFNFSFTVGISQEEFNHFTGLYEGFMSPEMISFFVIDSIVGIGIAIALFMLGGIVALGYAKFNLELVDKRVKPDVGTMFKYFRHWKTASIARLLMFVFVFLWSLLLIIPGIVASFSYAMTGYILAENPELSASEAIRRSKEMMRGKRWRFFCLTLSFIGWSILCIFTLGIGLLWLVPYTQASTAAFYRYVSGTGCHPERGIPEGL